MLSCTPAGCVAQTPPPPLGCKAAAAGNCRAAWKGGRCSCCNSAATAAAAAVPAPAAAGPLGAGLPLSKSVSSAARCSQGSSWLLAAAWMACASGWEMDMAGAASAAVPVAAMATAWPAAAGYTTASRASSRAAGCRCALQVRLPSACCPGQDRRAARSCRDSAKGSCRQQQEKGRDGGTGAVGGSGNTPETTFTAASLSMHQLVQSRTRGCRTRGCSCSSRTHLSHCAGSCVGRHLQLQHCWQQCCRQVNGRPSQAARLLQAAISELLQRQQSRIRRARPALAGRSSPRQRQLCRRLQRPPVCRIHLVCWQACSTCRQNKASKRYCSTNLNPQAGHYSGQVDRGPACTVLTCGVAVRHLPLSYAAAQQRPHRAAGCPRRMQPLAMLPGSAAPLALACCSRLLRSTLQLSLLCCRSSRRRRMLELVEDGGHAGTRCCLLLLIQFYLYPLHLCSSCRCSIQSLHHLVWRGCLLQQLQGGEEAGGAGICWGCSGSFRTSWRHRDAPQGGLLRRGCSAGQHTSSSFGSARQ